MRLHIVLSFALTVVAVGPGCTTTSPVSMPEPVVVHMDAPESRRPLRTRPLAETNWVEDQEKALAAGRLELEIRIIQMKLSFVNEIQSRLENGQVDPNIQTALGIMEAIRALEQPVQPDQPVAAGK